MKKYLIFCLATILLAACAPKESACEEAPVEIRNIIFMIGDGMGANQIYAALTKNGGKLNVERCTHTGLVKTYSANRYITDSAAGGTALATGCKTNNNMLGLDPDSLPIYSILSWFEEREMPTGFVVTSPVTHATPGAFYAHVPARQQYEDIAVQLYQSGIEFFAGGGRPHFINREDGANYIDSLIAKDYNVVNTIDDVQLPTLLPFAMIYDSIAMPPKPERDDYLPRAVDLAVHSLNAMGKGFFLMVEGSQIDYAGHDNDVRIVDEVLDFDEAVRVALDFAQADGHTLVVITADHETGGMSILDGNFETGEVNLQFNSTGHTGVMVPVYAYGPGAEQFTGIMQNSDIKGKIIDAITQSQKK